MKISVFGGSKPAPGDLAYEQAYRLGKLLAAKGHTVMTGGYIGTMEAVSRGACEAQGHVIGVTCDEIEAWRTVRPNQWIKEELRSPTLRERLMVLIETCDAAIALPGGVGTLTEIAMMWNHLLTEAISPRPLILIGPGWQSVVLEFWSQFGEYVPPAQRKWVRFAADIEEGAAMLEPQA